MTFFPRQWAPGLKPRYRKNGTVAWYWVASNCSPECPGYPIRTVRLDDDLDEQDRFEACRKHYGDMMVWREGRLLDTPKLKFTGNVKTMLDYYELHDDSPFHAVKYTTKKNYAADLRLLRAKLGHRKLKSLTGPDFIRWHRKLLEGSGGRRLVAKAHQVIGTLRRAVKWGVVLELPQCARIDTILSTLRFEGPRPRTSIMTYEQCRAIIDKAHEMGRPSVALVQVLQFELTMRRCDVIGEWLPDRTWANGLTWAHIDEDWVLDKVATKTSMRSAMRIRFDLKSYPSVMRELEKIPEDRRAGPVVISEKTRLPYTSDAFQRAWRKISRAAGVPADVWNMDSRAGGITEGSDAGADLEMLRHHASHSTTQMTARYSRATLDKTNRVAQLRLQQRAQIEMDREP